MLLDQANRRIEAAKRASAGVQPVAQLRASAPPPAEKPAKKPFVQLAGAPSRVERAENAGLYARHQRTTDKEAVGRVVDKLAGPVKKKRPFTFASDTIKPVGLIGRELELVDVRMPEIASEVAIDATPVQPVTAPCTHDWNGDVNSHAFGRCKLCDAHIQDQPATTGSIVEMLAAAGAGSEESSQEPAPTTIVPHARSKAAKPTRKLDPVARVEAGPTKMCGVPLPEDIHELLSAHAKANKRPLKAEVLEAIRRGLPDPL